MQIKRRSPRAYALGIIMEKVKKAIYIIRISPVIGTPGYIIICPEMKDRNLENI